MSVLAGKLGAGSGQTDQTRLSVRQFSAESVGGGRKAAFDFLALQKTIFPFEKGQPLMTV